MDANNYAKLVNQGRAKAISVPWTEEEWSAIQAVKGGERETLIANLRAGKVEPKVEEPKVGTPRVPTTSEPVKVEKKVKKIKR